MKRFLAFAAIMFLTAGCTAAHRTGAVGHDMGAGHEMTMHHQHILMGHGLAMALEGSNLIMLGDMKMAGDLDPLSVEHGRMMVADGKALIERGLSGPEMMAMHKTGKGPADDPAMKATHDLGESILKMVGLMEKLQAGGIGDHPMAVHHMHILINHGLGMAVKGANLAMIGDMKMAGDLDAPTAEHGLKMIDKGKALIGKVMDGGAMKEMHAMGKGPDKDPMMKHTHTQSEVAYQIIGHLQKMVGGK